MQRAGKYQRTVSDKNVFPEELLDFNHCKESGIRAPVAFIGSQSTHELCVMHLSSVLFIAPCVLALLEPYFVRIWIFIIFVFLVHIELQID